VHIQRIKPRRLLSINISVISNLRNTINLPASQLRKSSRRIVYISKVRRKQKNKGMFLARFVDLERVNSTLTLSLPQGED